jgi:hypothetical protein
MKFNEQTIDKNKQVPENDGLPPSHPEYVHTKNTYHLVQRTHIVRETLLVKAEDGDCSLTLKELIETNGFIVLNEDKQQVLAHLREFQTEREWLLGQAGMVYVPQTLPDPTADDDQKED